MFTNIISSTSLHFDHLQSRTRSTSNLTDLTDFLFLIRLSRNFTHVHKHHLFYEFVLRPSAVKNYITITVNRIRQNFWRPHSTDFISYPIVMKHECILIVCDALFHFVNVNTFPSSFHLHFCTNLSEASTFVKSFDN